MRVLAHAACGAARLQASRGAAAAASQQLLLRATEGGECTSYHRADTPPARNEAVSTSIGAFAHFLFEGRRCVTDGLVEQHALCLASSLLQACCRVLHTACLRSELALSSAPAAAPAVCVLRAGCKAACGAVTTSARAESKWRCVPLLLDWMAAEETAS